MQGPDLDRTGGEPEVAAGSPRGGASERPACPVCGGTLYDIRAKLQCRQCGRICESCCEGGLG